MKVVLDLEVNGDGAVQTTKSLKAQLKDSMNEATRLAEKYGETSAEAIKAYRNTANLKEQLADVKQTIDALHPEAKFNAIAGVVTGIAGGFAAAQGAMALFGTESEEVQKQLLKVQAALAFSQGLNEVMGLKDAFSNMGIVLKSTAIYTKLAAAAQGIYNFVVGAGSVALTVFRGALIATGLGAVIVLVGLLIANFSNLSKWVKDNSDKIKELAIMWLKFGNPVGLVITGITELGKRFQIVGSVVDFVKEKLGMFADAVIKLLEDLNILDTAQENMAQDDAERSQERVDNIEKVIKAKEREIELAKAEGKSAKELRDLEIKMLQERLAAYRDLADKREAIGEELTEEEKEKMDESSHALRLKVLEDVKITQQENDKILEEKKKAYEKLKEERKKQRDSELELERQIQDAKILLIEDEITREIAAINLSFNRKLENIKGNSQREIELRGLLEAEKTAAITAIVDKAEKDRVAKEAERQLKSFESNQAKLEADLINMQLAGQSVYDKEREIEQANYIGQLRFKELSDGEIERLEAEHKKRLAEIDKKEGEESLKVDQDIFNAKISIGQSLASGLSSLGQLVTNNADKQAKFNKAAAIVQLGVDTAKAISSTIVGATSAAATTGPAAPFVLGSYIATGIASVLTAFVTAKKALGAGGGIGSAPSIGGGQSVGTPQINLNSTDSPRTTLAKKETAIEVPPVRSYVVEYDISQSQKRIKNLEEKSTF